jgi:two-component system, sensor histidine kinase and response regulator
MLRLAAISIIVFEFANALIARFGPNAAFSSEKLLYLLPILVGIASYSMTMLPSLHRNWRACVIVLSILLIVDASLISRRTGQSEQILVTSMLVMFGTGTMMPWEPNWQLSVTVISLTGMLGATVGVAQLDPDIAVHWLCVLTSAFVSNLAVRLAHGYRRSLSRHLEAIHDHHQKLDEAICNRERVVAERELVLQKLADNEAMLRTILTAVPDHVVVKRLSDGMLVDFNADLTRPGVDHDEFWRLCGRPEGAWVSAQRRAEFRKIVDEHGVVRNLECEFYRSDGTIMPALLSAAAVDFNHETYVVSIARDITSLKDTQRRLEERELTLRRVLDASFDAISIVRVADGTFVDVNRAILELNHLRRDEVIGHTPLELGFWKDENAFVEFAGLVAREGEVREIEQQFNARDGRVVESLTSAVMMEINGDLCVVSFTRDITAAKKAQKELEAAREKALAASRAKSEFLASMSHEIRTPMNAILGMTDMLAESELSPEQRRYVNSVISNGNALLELINGILDLAKVESGRLLLEAVEFNPAELTERVLEALAIRAHEKGIELIGRISPATPYELIGDPLRLQQILINLVGNAIKFTHHGEVVVTVEHDPDTEAAGALLFSVTDSGIGIAQEKIASIFSPFTQADSSTTRSYGGTGLGLTIVARLVDMMHGKLNVISERGRGSTFSFTARFGCGGVNLAPQAPPAQQFAGLAVLVADPNPVSCKAIADILAIEGAHVTHVQDAEKVVEAIERSRLLGDPYALTLIDGRIPPDGGLELAQRICGHDGAHPEIVMMLATDDLTSKIARLKSIKVEGYVAKPIKRSELLAAIKGALKRSTATGDKPAAPIVPPAELPTLVDRPLKILVADDSSDNRMLVSAYLRKTPYQLEEVEDGQQAFDRATSGPYDLVLMDIQMPNVDGYTAVRMIRRWERENGVPRVPIIALTASALGEAVKKAYESGCDIHLAKPVKKATLLRAIRDAVSLQETLAPIRSAEQGAANG